MRTCSSIRRAVVDREADRREGDRAAAEGLRAVQLDVDAAVPGIVVVEVVPQLDAAARVPLGGLVADGEALGLAVDRQSGEREELVASGVPERVERLWRNLRAGYVAFEATHRVPTITVGRDGYYRVRPR